MLTVTLKGQRTMTCREFLERYSEYDDSLIPADEAERFRRHMERCSSCARYDRVLRKGRMVARQLGRPDPSADFIPRLQRRLLRQRPRQRMVMSGRLAAGLAAVTILMVTASAVRILDPASTPVAAESVVRSGEPAARRALDPSGALRGGSPPLARTARGVVRLTAAPTLPVVSRSTPRAWPATEVDPAGTASYSPLETGPPAYRRASPSSPSDFADSDRRALD